MKNLKDIWTRNLTRDEDYCYRVGWNVSAVLHSLLGFGAGVLGALAYMTYDNPFLWRAFRVAVHFCLQ